MMAPIFYIKDGNLSFADKIVLSDIELYISRGDVVCLVGRNGSGKSSLMKIITGEYELDSGSLFKDMVTNIGWLRQDMKSLPRGKIYDFILSDFKDKQSSKYNADIILEELEIDGNAEFKNCSGGQVRRALLAKALIHKPDILLLDEPTNHLDIKAIEWLENYIKKYQGAIICVSHDRRFQENITNKIWWIDRATLRKSNRGFRYYDQWREEIISSEEAVLRKINRKLEAEKSWLNTGVTARRKRNQKRLSDLYRLRESFKEQQTHLRSAKERVQITLEENVKKNKFIIEAKKVSYNLQNKILFDNFSFQVKKGEKIGVIGPNGIGKSTLIRILTKELEPTNGSVIHGTNLDITYFDQHRNELNQDCTLKQIFCPSGSDQVFLKNKTMHVAGYLKKFMFDPRSLDDKISTLSGGQANRLLLAKSLINPGNFFILDEPTNDLDIDSLEIISEILADYTGTLVIVSHDRDFLERLVTRTLVFTDDGIVDLYGGYEDYLKYHKKEKLVLGNSKNNASVSNVSTHNKKTQKKLSYKYTRLLETLPNEIKLLEQEICDIEIKFSDSDLYNKDNDKFNRLLSDLQKLKLELDSKQEKLLEIEIMQEEINSFQSYSHKQ